MDEPRSKTYVLVHGGWHGGWCWTRVAEPLRASGHRVFTPTQTGLGERSHLVSPAITLEVFIQDVVNVLEWEDLTDVILVGHSFGGVSITGTADRVPWRIRHLVYLDAVVLEDGQNRYSALPAGVAETRRKLAQESSGGVLLPPVEPADLGVTDPADAAWVKAKMTAHPMRTFEDTLHLTRPVGAGLPVTYVATTPYFELAAPYRLFARKQPGWGYVEIAGGHDAMVTSPNALVEVLRTF
jgi:pimeloyl-ACP methyl ester carboxylesterase